MDTDIFTLFKNYHDKSLKEVKNEILEQIENIKLLLNLKNENKKSHICGFKRTRNRGICKKLCFGEACFHHMKYINNKTNEDIYKEEKENVNLDQNNYGDSNKPQENPDIPEKPEENELNGMQEHNDKEDSTVNKKKKKNKNKKLKKKKYLNEYKSLCDIISNVIKIDTRNSNEKDHIPHEHLININEKINYEKNKFYDKNNICNIIMEIANEFEKINDRTTCIDALIVYCYSLLNCFIREDYQYEGLIEIKKNLKVI